MITVRRSHERGHAAHGWLDSHHTFSFADYHDPKHMGFRALRVINEDRVQPGAGFGMHSHRDMEIISYVLAGALAHKDSMGNSAVVKPGEVQRMSAGTGVTHSENNPSTTEPVHFLQIWLVPEARGLAPSYEQRQFALDAGSSGLRLVASRDGRDASVRVHQDVDLYAGRLASGAETTRAIGAGRGAWVQVVRGAIALNDVALAEGDGAAVEAERRVAIRATEDAEVLLFDLA